MSLPALRLRSKAFLLTAILLTLVVAATALMLIKLQADALHDEFQRTAEAMRQQLSTRARLLASAQRSFVKRAREEHQYDLIANELSALTQGQRGVRYAILMDTHRRALFHPNPERVTRRLDDERARWAAEQSTLAEREFSGDEPILEVAIPILQDGIDKTGADVRTRAGTLRFGLSMGALNRAMREAENRAEERIHRSWRLAGALSAAALVFGLVIAFIFGGRLARPIEQLTRDAEAIAQGHLDQPIHAQSRDEIGRLATSFDEMRRGIQSLLARTAEKARMESELETARAVQKTLLPPTAPTSEKFQVAAFYEPATEMGGDWYTYLLVGEQSLYVIVGDVTGHGAASALVAASARSVCSTLANGIEAGLVADELSPSAILQMLNREIASIGGDEHMMTSAAIQLDLATGALMHANAAHNKPLILRADGTLHVLGGTGPVLGENLDLRYKNRENQLSAGDILLLYTDGLIENTDHRERQWGRRRLVSALRRAAETDRVGRVVQSLRNSALRFYNGVAIADDVTFVVIRATPEAELTTSAQKRATLETA